MTDNGNGVADSLSSAFEVIAARFGRLDVLVDNAASFPRPRT